jgi:hypothetical protein
VILEDIELFCVANQLDYAEVGDEHELGAGMLFHWRNPNDAYDGECLHVTWKALEETEPAKLLAAIVHGRNVVHVTRIVGYMSHTHNWNKSKLGELKDRRKGDYSFKCVAVGEVAPST